MAPRTRSMKTLPIPHPFTGDDYACGFPVTLLPELVLMAASNAIREKPLWWEKYKDPVIAARWRQELVAMREENDEPLQLTDPQIDYLFAELDWYAKQRLKHLKPSKNDIPIEIGIDGTRKADGLIPLELKQRLLAGVQKLMDVPEHLKDWHPGSNKQVLDLVHPSLFPFIADRTLVVQDQAAIPPLSFIGQGETMDMAPMKLDVDKMYYSKKYQWLPTDFTLTPDGQVEFESYINNLHPVEHGELYPVLGEILAKFMPMFEDVLTDMRALPKKKKRFEVDPFNWYGDEPEVDWENNEAEAEATMEDWRENRYPNMFDVPVFSSPEEPERYEIQPGQKLQVIVKLANIELTPENPTYEGGVWHVEGMANENIVASGIYYYHSENISDTRLNFRIHVQEPDYAQGDDTGVLAMFGLEDEEALVQNLDGIVTKQDRCIAFPNIYQHQVQPFGLADPTKPGTRKILVFFLVNPETPILSTTHVPPQQKEWAPMKGVLLQAARKLPAELVQEIDKHVDWPMELEEAFRHREELMKQRKYFVSSMTEEVFARPFSLCEH
ncbi:hypothetical protein BGZ59_008976 [Podila verticillata]|nr:hypothetical protein BGZ59_008976 [Podila verticillata]